MVVILLAKSKSKEKENFIFRKFNLLGFDRLDQKPQFVSSNSALSFLKYYWIFTLDCHRLWHIAIAASCTQNSKFKASEGMLLDHFKYFGRNHWANSGSRKYTLFCNRPIIEHYFPIFIRRKKFWICNPSQIAERDIMALSSSPR